MLSLPYSLHHFFYKNIGGRTYQSIFNSQMIDLINFFTVSMSIFLTSCRSYIINISSIILIKKKTREILQDLVIILIYTEKFLFKISGFHSQMLGNSINILLYIERSCGFTAVSTLQTIDFLKNFSVDILHQII